MIELLWYIFSGLALASALGVVLMKRPIYSALCLVLHLFMVAALFAFLDAHFLAVAQVIVYAGAIMVLVIFVIMLLSVEGSEKKSSKFAAFLGVVAALSLLKILLPVLRAEFPMTGTDIQGEVGAIGRTLFREYIYTFEVASVLIMVAIVGAVILAKRIKPNVTAE